VFVSGTPSALPDADVDEVDQRDWHRTPYGSWRLSVEVKAMTERFPSFLLVGRNDGHLAWKGSLASAVSARRYRVTVSYPFTFPDEAPTVSIDAESFQPGTPHLLDGSRPCLYYPGQGPRNGYDPARTTAATLVAWTALWIHAYETWQATGRWPGRAD
jgi:hypothetical protein